MPDEELPVEADEIEEDEPEADEPEEGTGGETLLALEEKYREQMRQIMPPQKIELPISTLPAMISNQIDLNPDFQRRGRWDQARQSRFIESIIMNVPIPPVFFGEDEYGMYVVLDGRQRLTALHDFLRNNYRLKGLKVWKELNGQNFNDLQKQKIDRFLVRRFVPAVVILKESSAEIKYDVFDRLNTGAVTAEPMEIRNAVFRGDFNKLLRSLSDNATFRRLWDIPTEDIQRETNATYANMDDLELVLRFFALRKPEEMKLNFKDYLGDYLNVRNGLYKEHPELKAEDEKEFLWAVKNCWRIFGDTAFRKPPTQARSKPLADAYMVALSKVDPRSIGDDKVTKVRDALNTLVVNDTDFKKSVGTGTNGKGAISTRITKADAAVQAALA